MAESTMIVVTLISALPSHPLNHRSFTAFMIVDLFQNPDSDHLLALILRSLLAMFFFFLLFFLFQLSLTFIMLIIGFRQFIILTVKREKAD
jgi:hypothetical protein